VTARVYEIKRNKRKYPIVLAAGYETKEKKRNQKKETKQKKQNIQNKTKQKKRNTNRPCCGLRNKEEKYL